MLGGLELRAGHNDEALKIAQQVQSQVVQLPAGYVLEGDIRMAEKKFIEAAALYEKAYGLGKNGALAMKIHAAQTQAGKPEEGEARVKQWLKENPEDLTVRFYLADAYLKASKYPAAIEEYAGLLKKQPDNLVALNNLAWAYQQVKDPRALEYAEKAYQLKPDNAAVADTLGWMLVEQGKTERGLGLLEQAVSLAPDAQEIRYHLAHAWLKSGDRIKARDELERILSGGTKFPQEQEAIQLLKELRN
jgi:putative PEP-CTERM system TPR-repeat lipoprotein